MIDLIRVLLFDHCNTGFVISSIRVPFNVMGWVVSGIRAPPFVSK
jgi:hypothetical protein